MKITAEFNDRAIVEELGHRLTQARINISLSQAALAQRAGIGKRTLERLESGESVQVATLVRVLRELRLLDNLDILAPEAGPRPMDYLSRKGRVRQRAPRVFSVQEPPPQWTWGDEK